MEKTNNKEEQKEKTTFNITDKGKGGNSDYPAPDKIGSRSSTVARAMASTLMPRIGATNQEKRNIILLSLGEDIVNEIDNKMDGANTVKIKDKKGNVIGESFRKDIKDEKGKVIRTLIRDELKDKKGKVKKTLIKDELKDEKGKVIRTLIRDEKWEVITTSKLGDLKCVYCGEPATNLDHLFPFIKDKRPTGYFTEPANLVPCCDKCNQKKGAKYWYDYMNELIHAAEENKKTMLKSRKNHLKKYCNKNKLPTSNKNQQRNNHKLVFNDDVLSWWDRLYKQVVSSLDNAQIQIDAFKAGIKYSTIFQDIDLDKTCKILNCFNQYFEKLIQNELEDINQAGKKADDAQKAANQAEEKAKNGSKEAINNAKKKRKAAENAKTKFQIAQKALLAIQNSDLNAIVDEEIKEYFLLVGYGFRLAKDSQKSQIIQSKTDVAQIILDSAKTAFQKGFTCARTSNKKIIEDCIKKDWLKDVDVLEKI